MEKKFINRDSLFNKHIQKQLVEREVIFCCSETIKKLEKTDLVYEICRKFSGGQNEIGDAIKFAEFWSVSESFGEMLKKHGQKVESIAGLTVWSRRAYVMPLGRYDSLYVTEEIDSLLERSEPSYVIFKIAKDMGILYEQENSWWTDN